MRLIVTLNGTHTNPWSKYELKFNPFPQIADARYVAGCMAINSLDGDPILPETYKEEIRKRLDGFTEEFIQLCIDRYEPGERSEFIVTFDE